jgi:hypothetical protein
LNVAKPLIVLVGSVVASAAIAWAVGFSPILAGTIAAIIFSLFVGVELVAARVAPEHPVLGYAAVLKGSATDGFKVLLGGLGCSIPLILMALLAAYLFSEFGR